MEITPADALPAAEARAEHVADYLLDREERGLLDGLGNGAMGALMEESRHELLAAGYTWAEISTF